MVCSSLPSGVNFMNCMWCPSVSQAFPSLIEADGMREAEHARAPGEQELAVAVEHDDRMLGAAIEAIDAVVRIDRHRRRLHLDAGRHVRPVLVHLVGVFLPLPTIASMISPYDSPTTSASASTCSV